MNFEDYWPSIKNITGFLVPGQEEWLYNKTKSLADGAVILEIGSYKGRSTAALAAGCVGTSKRVYSIDTFKGNKSDFIKGENSVEWTGDEYFGEFKENLKNAGVYEYVFPLIGESKFLSKYWAREIDFIFIDASHEYLDVLEDFYGYFPWLKENGYMALHDVTPAWDGPYKAWKNVVRHNLVNIGNESSISYGQKDSTYKPDVNILIPVHNRLQLTKSCLDSIYASEYDGKLKVTVIDDCSTDNTTVFIKENYPDCNVITQREYDLWWSGAIRKAIEEISPNVKEKDYYLLVNNDTIVEKNTIQILTDLSKKYGRVNITPAAHKEGGGLIDVGGFFTWDESLSFGLNIRTGGYHPILKIRNADALFGRCTLFPKELINAIGNVDSLNFPQYWGDTDFFLRARRGGFRNTITNQTSVTCREDNETTGTHYSRIVYSLKDLINLLCSERSNYNLYNAVRFIKKNAPPGKIRYLTKHIKKRNISICLQRYWPVYYSKLLFGVFKIK